MLRELEAWRKREQVLWAHGCDWDAVSDRLGNRQGNVAGSKLL